MTANDEIKFPNFDDIPVSTKTIIAMTNVSMNISKMFNTLPITPFEVVKTKRGRKPKLEVPVNKNSHLKVGDIISLKYCGELRGVDLKKPKKSTTKKNFFRNALCVIMVVDTNVYPVKQVNFKISRNGKFQLTGCKEDSHAEICVKKIWDYLNELHSPLSGGASSEASLKESSSREASQREASLREASPRELKKQFKTEAEKAQKELHSPLFVAPSPDTPFSIVLIPAMRNIDFNLGFLTNRDELHKYFLDCKNEDCSSYISLLETSIGYTGINIKIPSKIPISDLKLKKIIYEKTGERVEYVSYQDYLDTMDSKEQKKKLDKERYNTFLIFQSGKTIMTSMCAEFARDVYNDFIHIIQNNYEKFREKLE